MSRKMAAGNMFRELFAWLRHGPKREPVCCNCGRLIRPIERAAHPNPLQPIVRYWTADWRQMCEPCAHKTPSVGEMASEDASYTHPTEGQS